MNETRPDKSTKPDKAPLVGVRGAESIHVELQNSAAQSAENKSAEPSSGRTKSRFFRLLKDYWQERFGERVQKVPINAGFTCPGRNPEIGSGCTYCLNQAFSPFYCDAEKPVKQQLQEGIHFFANKYKARKFIAYFQSFSGTNASKERLREIFSEALDFRDVVGLIVATRPDCLDEERVKLLADFSPKFVGVEIGIESILPATLRRINRGHTVEQTRKAIKLAASYGLFVGGHIILGLPGENPFDRNGLVQFLNSLPLDAVKFHHLQVLRGTPMEKEFLRFPLDFPSFSIEEYVRLLIEIIEALSPKVFLDRFISQSPQNLLLHPIWGRVTNPEFIKILENSLEERKTFQGRFFS